MSEPELPEIDQREAARLMTTYIRADWIQSEPALFRTKWFDYRFMNPVEATLIYVDAYEKVYRRMYRTNLDHRAAEHIRIPTAKTLFEQKKEVISGIWRGRQVADAVGMPYDRFIDRAFHHRLRFWQQRHLPRPHQIYGTIGKADPTPIAAFVANDWEEQTKAQLLYSKHDAYTNRRYADLHSQNDHHEWLLAQAQQRPGSAEVIARLIFQEQLLPAEKVEARLEPAEFDRVMSFADSNPARARYN